MTELRQVVLVVEDEPQMRRFLKASLASHGYRLIEASTVAQGERLLTESRPDVVLLDLGLPDGDGIEFTRRIREWSRVPIVVVSARGQEEDKVDALDAGADDYLTKPFGVRELLARLRVALRHRGGDAADGQPVIEIGPLRLDLGRHEVEVAGRPVHLTRTEYRLLALLAQNAGRVLTNRQILTEVWGREAAEQTHYVRVYMAELRKKIEADPARPRLLVTEQGIGYRLRDRGAGPGRAGTRPIHQQRERALAAGPGSTGLGGGEPFGRAAVRRPSPRNLQGGPLAECAECTTPAPRAAILAGKPCWHQPCTGRPSWVAHGLPVRRRDRRLLRRQHRVRARVRPAVSETMNFEYAVGVVLTVLLSGYLGYALVRPERF